VGRHPLISAALEGPALPDQRSSLWTGILGNRNPSAKRKSLDAAWNASKRCAHWS